MQTESTPVADLPPAEQEAIAAGVRAADAAAGIQSDAYESSPEFITDDELFGPHDEADERS